MKYFDWDEKKNAKLKSEREVCFEDVVTAIDEGNLLEVLEHHKPDKYPNQKTKQLLGWQPKVPMKDALENFFAYMKEMESQK